jgi:hypothetical protein
VKALSRGTGAIRLIGVGSAGVVPLMQSAAVMCWVSDLVIPPFLPWDDRRHEGRN